MLISVMLEGKEGVALKEGAKAVVGTFKNTAEGKFGKGELTRAVARAKFELAAGVEARERRRVLCWSVWAQGAQERDGERAGCIG
jgi:hypothetical protein